MSGPKFENALKRLEEIVKDLERGDLQLDDALKLFEEGVKLSKACLDILENAEKKIEILMQDKDGVKRARPFAIDLNEGDN